MATNYTISLTDAQKKAMEYVSYSVQDWVENAVFNRASEASEEIYNAEVLRMNEDESITTIPADKDQVVLAANIKSAKTRHEEFLAENP
jgi:hypothetical protein